MSVRVREVLPRDGFQDHPAFIPTQVKAEIVALLHGAGSRWIEVTSFVHPTQLPQFRDAEEVATVARELPGLVLSAFVPNRRGLQRALTVGIDEVSLAVASTNQLAQANFHRGREEVVAEVLDTAAMAADQGVDVSVTIGGAFGCPFEGDVDPEDIAALARQIADAGVGTILLADTIGAGGPTQVGGLVARVRAEVPSAVLGVHIHGHHGVAAVQAAVAAGATVVDAALGGFGGCPFVPDAPGNVDTARVLEALAEPATDGDQRHAAIALAAAQIRALLEGA